MPTQVARAEAHRHHGNRVGRATATDQQRQGADPLPHSHRREAWQPVQQGQQHPDHGRAGQQQPQQIASPARPAAVDIGLAQPVPEQAQVQVTGQRTGNAQRQVQARLLADGAITPCAFSSSGTITWYNTARRAKLNTMLATSAATRAHRRLGVLAGVEPAVPPSAGRMPAGRSSGRTPTTRSCGYRRH